MDTYELGPFRLDTQSRMLLRGSEPVLLGRRAVALLRALVERPGALVSKDALIEAAWPGPAVEDSNLLVQIATLRQALGEAPGGERWTNGGWGRSRNRRKAVVARRSDRSREGRRQRRASRTSRGLGGPMPCDPKASLL
jgi:hypothetical protein